MVAGLEAWDRVRMTKRALERVSGQEKHLWAARRGKVSTLPPIIRSAYWKAVRTFFPWDAWTYPGVEAGAVDLSHGRASIYAIRRWRQGTRKPPKWAWHLIAIEAERRAVAFQHVAELAKKEAGD